LLSKLLNFQNNNFEHVFLCFPESATCEDVGLLDSLPRSVVRGWPVSLTCGVMVGNWAATLNVPPPDGEDLVVTASFL